MKDDYCKLSNPEQLYFRVCAPKVSRIYAVVPGYNSAMAALCENRESIQFVDFRTQKNGFHMVISLSELEASIRYVKDHDGISFLQSVLREELARCEVCGCYFVGSASWREINSCVGRMMECYACQGCNNEKRNYIQEIFLQEGSLYAIKHYDDVVNPDT